MPWVTLDAFSYHAVEYVLQEFPDLTKTEDWGASGIVDRRAVTAIFKDANGVIHPMMVLVRRKYRPLDAPSILLFKNAIAPLRRRFPEARIMVVTNTDAGSMRIISGS